MVQILTIFIHIRQKLESDASKLGYYNISTSSKTCIHTIHDPWETTDLYMRMDMNPNPLP